MKHMKKLLSMLLIAVFVISMAQFSTVEAQAASKPRLAATSATILKCSNQEWGECVINAGKGKITSVKSSNSKVVKAYKNTWGDGTDYFYQGLSAGKAAITVKFKVGSKVYTFTEKVTVLDDKPFKFIKYNGKNVYKGHEYESNTLGSVPSGKSISWELKSGYKMVSAKYFYEGSSKQKNLKNNQTITLKKNTLWCVFNIKTPTGKIVEYRVVFV